SGGGGAPSNNKTNPGKEEEGAGKMFIGHLSWNTSKMDLQDSFTKFGDCTIKMDPNTSRSRGSGSLLFKDAAGVKVLDQEHRRDGGVTDPKKAMAMREPIKKFFVGVCILKPLRRKSEFLGGFGEIKAIDHPMDPKSNKRQGFVFITFKEEEAL
ncbi:Heterogeneous nuclear ribonucleoprotein A/B, partial [Myotis brandtii]